MSAPRQPQEDTLAEFGSYRELLTEAGRQFLTAEDDLMLAEDREARRNARRNASGSTADAIGRGRVQ